MIISILSHGVSTSYFTGNAILAEGSVRTTIRRTLIGDSSLWACGLEKGIEGESSILISHTVVFHLLSSTPYFCFASS